MDDVLLFLSEVHRYGETSYSECTVIACIVWPQSVPDEEVFQWGMHVLQHTICLVEIA